MTRNFIADIDSDAGAHPADWRDPVDLADELAQDDFAAIRLPGNNRARRKPALRKFRRHEEGHNDD